MVSDHIREIPGFPPRLASELKHCILAHHGELEYGSPKKPAILEAMALNFADNADAKMETMIEVLQNAGDNQGWLGYNRLLETNIRKTSDGEGGRGPIKRCIEEGCQKVRYPELLAALFQEVYVCCMVYM